MKAKALPSARRQAPRPTGPDEPPPRWRAESRYLGLRRCGAAAVPAGGSARPSPGRRSRAAAESRRCWRRRCFRFGRRRPSPPWGHDPAAPGGDGERRSAARFLSRPGGAPRLAALFCLSQDCGEPGSSEPGTPASAAAPGAPPSPSGRPGLPARRSSSIAAASCAASRDSSATGAAAPGCPQRAREPSALSRDSAERRVMEGGGRGHGPARTQVGGCPRGEVCASSPPPPPRCSAPRWVHGPGPRLRAQRERG